MDCCEGAAALVVMHDREEGMQHGVRRVQASRTGGDSGLADGTFPDRTRTQHLTLPRSASMPRRTMAHSRWNSGSTSSGGRSARRHSGARFSGATCDVRSSCMLRHGREFENFQTMSLPIATAATG